MHDPIVTSCAAVARAEALTSSPAKQRLLPVSAAVYERLSAYAKQTKRTLAGAVDWCVEHQARRDGIDLTPQTETAAER